MPDSGNAGGLDSRADHLALWQEIRRLPPRMRATLVLRYFEDLTEAATAEALGCSVGAVKSQTHHAVTRLRAALPDLDAFKGTDMTGTDIRETLHAIGTSVDVPSLDHAAFQGRVRRTRTRRTASRVGGAALALATVVGRRRRGLLGPLAARRDARALR